MGEDTQRKLVRRVERVRLEREAGPDHGVPLSLERELGFYPETKRDIEELGIGLWPLQFVYKKSPRLAVDC